jgi:hypothetical protein
MNYLASFLQTELSEAAERILGSHEKTSSFGKIPLPVTARKLVG